MKKANFRNGMTNKLRNKFQREIQRVLSQFLYPKRNLVNLKSKLSGSYSLIYHRQTGKEKKYLPPKLFVGKGYSDKGNARNKAFDGSPTWQEVANHRGNLYHKGKKINE